MNILVTGANGQVGSELRDVAKKLKRSNFIFTTRNELDLSNPQNISQFFANNNIDYCINCAAYTAVDKAEEEDKLAYAINSKAPQILAKACQSQGAVFIHLSTDYVYDDSTNRPLLETDNTNPNSIYGQTKLYGDLFALKNNAKTIIIRTSWVYSAYGNNFVKTMIRLGTERDNLNIVFDQIGSPTYAKNIATSIIQIIQKLEIKQDPKYFGVFHYSDEGVCSWYDFALAIFELKTIQCNVLPITSDQYPTPAKRPHFSLLNKQKIKTTFDLTIPHWKDSLIEVLKLID